MLSALQATHATGYVHCDLKLDNICAMFNQKTNDCQYTLIDFGLSQKFIKNSNHIEEKRIDHFRGNILFAS
jgi:serine/threonine protein kinase